MSLPKWALAILAVSALVLGSGCSWYRAYDVKTGARLDGDYKGPRCADIKVFVSKSTMGGGGGGSSGGGPTLSQRTELMLRWKMKLKRL